MNQPCQHCLRGLTIGKNEVCEPCRGTGFVQEQYVLVSSAGSVYVANSKVKKAVKKVLKKK